MKALKMECHTSTWWGDWWKSEYPQEIGAEVVGDDGLPNAPLMIHIMTTDTEEAVRLLRLAADLLEQDSSFLPEKLHQNIADSLAINGVVLNG